VSFDLALYVAGQSPRSLAAISNLHAICERHLSGRCMVTVVDLMQQPRRARDDQIVALPTLVRRHPLPARKVIGDLSDTDRVLAGLDIHAR
jgi:circadian clock protein KaiB